MDTEKEKSGVHIVVIRSMQIDLRMQSVKVYFLSVKIRNVEKYLS